MDDAAGVGIEHRRVGRRAAVEIEVVVEEKLDVALVGAEIPHHDLAQIDVGIGIDGVVAAQPDSDRLVLAEDVGDQRVAKIDERALPGVVFHPAHRAVHPHAEAKARAGMILQPDVRVVHVGQPVFRIERRDERAVADQQITWHGRSGSLSGVRCPWHRSQSGGMAAALQITVAAVRMP